MIEERKSRLHIVQVGSDDSVFFAPAGEPYQRQIGYGRILAAVRPGSTISLLVLTSRSGAMVAKDGNVRFIPVHVRQHGLRKFVAWRRLYVALSNLHKEEHIDLITTQNVHDEAWTVLLFGHRIGVPIVGQVHYDIFDQTAAKDVSRNRTVSWLRSYMTQRFLPSFAAVRVVGESIGKEICKRRLNSCVHVLPVPVAMMKCDCCVSPMVAGKQVVLFVGRLCAQKNLDDWLRVAQQVSKAVPSCQFKLVGDGALLLPLKSLARELGIQDRTEFHGFVPYDRLPELYRSAAVFLLTSHYEGFGRVVAEAYSNRVPVVATQVAGVEDIVMNGKTGFLHPHGDIIGMAQSVVRLLEDAELRKSMGTLGGEVVRAKFDPKVLAEQWIQLLVNTVAARIC